MGDLRSLYSWAWDSYAFLTHVVRELFTHDRGYRRLLDPRGDASSSWRFDSLQSTPSMEQVLPRVRPSRGPSLLSSAEQAPPSSDDAGSASMRRRRRRE